MRHERIFSSALLLAACLGCQSMGGRGALFQNSGGRENPKVDDPWIKDTGDIARGEHPPEEVHDPLGLRNIFTSEKAREIERNVGVGD